MVLSQLHRSPQYNALVLSLCTPCLIKSSQHGHSWPAQGLRLHWIRDPTIHRGENHQTKNPHKCHDDCRRQYLPWTCSILAACCWGLAGPLHLLTQGWFIVMQEESNNGGLEEQNNLSRNLALTGGVPSALPSSAAVAAAAVTAQIQVSWRLTPFLKDFELET